MNNKTIIFAATCFLLASFVFLSFSEQKKQDVNSQDWWSFYFANPKDQSLNFTIENHSNNTVFHWEAYENKNKFNEGEITLQKGQQKTIPLSFPEAKEKKITIIATNQDNNKKEIYKSF